ncbi:MAG: hypothetical protein ACHQJ7_03810 [Vicinamibacteria bacterium]
MLGIMIAYPWLAFVTAGVLVALWLWRRATSAAVAAALWIAYGAYETLMHLRVLCTGECNIRVDLLLFYPVLLVATLVALWRSLRRRARTA